MALSTTPNGYLPSRHPKRLAAERAKRIKELENADADDYTSVEYEELQALKALVKLGDK